MSTLDVSTFLFMFICFICGYFTYGYLSSHYLNVDINPKYKTKYKDADEEQNDPEEDDWDEDDWTEEDWKKEESESDSEPNKDVK